MDTALVTSSAHQWSQIHDNEVMKVYRIDRAVGSIEFLVPMRRREVNVKKEYVVPALEDLGSVRDETQSISILGIRLDDGGGGGGGGSTFS